MPYKILLMTIISVIILYLISGAITTLIFRANNPLKKMDTSKKTIYLTFDDGIHPVYTPQVLNVLKEHNIKASFFILASTAQNNIDIIERMQQEGHIIGLHSFDHKNQILQNPFSIKKNFAKSLGIFRSLGISPVYFRPPFGHISLSGIYLCKKHGLTPVLWNVIVQDWEKNTSVPILCNKLNTKVHGCSVICVHDGRGKNQAPLKTIDTLKIMIPLWIKEDYTFETVDKLY